jgi:hypothetical protein
MWEVVKNFQRKTHLRASIDIDDRHQELRARFYLDETPSGDYVETPYLEIIDTGTMELAVHFFANTNPHGFGSPTANTISNFFGYKDWGAGVVKKGSWGIRGINYSSLCIPPDSLESVIPMVLKHYRENWRRKPHSAFYEYVENASDLAWCSWEG